MNNYDIKKMYLIPIMMMVFCFNTQGLYADIDEIPKNLSGSYKDPIVIELENLNNTHYYQIYWGDGVNELSDSLSENESIFFSHHYNNTGIFTISIKLMEDDSIINERELEVYYYTKAKPTQSPLMRSIPNIIYIFSLLSILFLIFFIIIFLQKLISRLQRK